MSETVPKTESKTDLEPVGSSRLLRTVLTGMGKAGLESAPHLTTLYTLAKNWSFGHVVEIGVGRFSTMALLSGVLDVNRCLVSYDIKENAGAAVSTAIGDRAVLSSWEFRNKHSLVAPEDFPDSSVSLLFADTSRDYADTRDELSMWAPKIHNRGIICGLGPLLADEGIKRAIEEFASLCDRVLEVIPGGIGLYILWPKEDVVIEKPSPAATEASQIPEDFPAHGTRDPHISGGVVWLSGPSLAEKDALARTLYERMARRGTRVQVLDDSFRRSLFGDADKTRILERSARIAAMLARQGVWTVVPTISSEPGRKAQAIISEYGMSFVEVLVQKDGSAKASELVVDPEKEGEAAFRVLEALALRTENPPVILVGRGGSGTRLLSQIAQDCGVFVGVPGNVNECHDSLDWVELIYRMVWDTRDDPALPAGDRYRSDIVKNARHVLSVNPVPFGAMWGWKLPETMLVLPLMLDAFPGAKVIHMVRHPVSASIRRLHVTADPTNSLGEASLYGAYQYGDRDPAQASLDEEWRRSAYTWLHQVTRVARHGRTSLGSSRYLEIHYEDVCERPEEAVRNVAAFLGVPVPRYCPSFVIDRARMNPWAPEDTRAQEIWSLCGRTATRLGYGPEGLPAQ